MGSCPDADIDSTRFNKNRFALALHFDTEFSELRGGVFSVFGQTDWTFQGGTYHFVLCEPPEEIRLMKRTSLLPKRNFLFAVPRANAFFLFICSFSGENQLAQVSHLR